MMVTLRKVNSCAHDSISEQNYLNFLKNLERIASEFVRILLRNVPRIHNVNIHNKILGGSAARVRTNTVLFLQRRKSPEVSLTGTAQLTSESTITIL